MIRTPPRHRKGMRVTHWRRASGRRRRQQAYAAPARLSARRIARRSLPNKPQPQHRDPITQAELTHLSRRADQRRRPAAVLLYVAFGTSVALTILLGLIPKSGNQMTATMRDTYVLLSNTLQVVNVALLALSFVGQVILSGQALLLGSDAIAREKQNATWELLLLTGRDAGQLVTGKWRAVQLYLFQRYGLMILLRAASLLWLGLTAGRGGGIIFERPDLLSLLVAPTIVLVATVLDLMLASTVGVTASVAIRRGFAYPAALGLFVVCLFLFIAVYLGMTAISYGIDLNYISILHAPLVMMAWPMDGGELLGLSLMRPIDVREWVIVFSYIAANLVVFAALIGALLWLARRLADRPGTISTKASTA